MPAAHPVEFRLRAVELAREGSKPVAVVAKDLGISVSCLRNWMHRADIETNTDASAPDAAMSSADKKELVARHAELTR